MWVLSCLADKLLGKLCTFVEEGNRQSHLQEGDSLCGEEVSSADFSGCRGTVASSLWSSRFLFVLVGLSLLLSRPALLPPFPPPRSSRVSLSLSWLSLPFSALSVFSLSLLSDFLLSGPRTRAGNKRDTCQSKKGLRWARVMLRQSVSLIISPPPEWCVSDSLVSSLSPDAASAGRVALSRGVSEVNLRPALCRSVRACLQLLLST